MKLYISESNIRLMKDLNSNPHTAKEKGLTRIIKSNKLRLVLNNKKIIYNPKIIDKILFEEEKEEEEEEEEQQILDIPKKKLPDEDISNLNLPKTVPEKKKINISDEECMKLLYN